MYPNITLQIKNQIATLIYSHAEGEDKNITSSTENLRDVIINLAKKLDLTEKSAQNTDALLKALLLLARESDESYIMEYPDIDLETTEFQLEKAINSFLATVKNVDIYESEDLDQEIKDELIRNQNSDIFACALEYLYMHMVAKALLAGSELGLGIIRLSDDSKNTRLQEKMAMELERMGVEFIVD